MNSAKSQEASRADLRIARQIIAEVRAFERQKKRGGNAQITRSFTITSKGMIMNGGLIEWDMLARIARDAIKSGRIALEPLRSKIIVRK